MRSEMQCEMKLRKQPGSRAKTLRQERQANVGREQEHGKKERDVFEFAVRSCSFFFYVKPAKFQPGFNSRNLCWRSCAAVGRSFGLLCRREQLVRKKQGDTIRKTYTAK